jgi:hypothetical protein
MQSPANPRHIPNASQCGFHFEIPHDSFLPTSRALDAEMLLAEGF